MGKFARPRTSPDLVQNLFSDWIWAPLLYSFLIQILLESSEHIKRLSWSASHILPMNLNTSLPWYFPRYLPCWCHLLVWYDSMRWHHWTLTLGVVTCEYSRLQAFLYFFLIKWAQHLMFLATGGPGGILIWMQQLGYKMIRIHHDSRLLHVSSLRFLFKTEGQQSQRQQH